MDFSSNLKPHMHGVGVVDVAKGLHYFKKVHIISKKINFDGTYMFGDWSKRLLTGTQVLYINMYGLIR